MVDDKLNDLLGKEGVLLARSVAQTMKSYHESPTVANLKNWEAARRAYEDFQARKAAEANPGERRFKTLAPDVLEYLKATGWKIEKSKLYADRNKIDKETDGTYTIKAVDDYARLRLTRLDGSDDNFCGFKFAT
ncbi:MAG: hypothetical protein HZB22_01455 [Deltaproteobacteria bacterium]|nr:hypothetical protein [Deltaproteobacteria bacterium]